MQRALPAVVLAHQSGCGVGAYKRNAKLRRYEAKPYSYALDMRFMITPVETFARNKSTHQPLMTTAFCVYLGGYRIGEIQQSSNPMAVEAALADWLKGK